MNKIFRMLFVVFVFSMLSVLVMVVVQVKDIIIWCWDFNFNVVIMKEVGVIYFKVYLDINIKVVDFVKVDVEVKLQMMFVLGVMISLLDIVFIEDYGVQKYIQFFFGVFVLMNDVVDYFKFVFYKVKFVIVDGKIYFMFFDFGVIGFYYCKDYLEQVGYKLEDMQNLIWDKYIEIGKKVFEKIGKKMMGFDLNDVGFICIMMQLVGGWYFNDKGELNIIGNEVLKVVLKIEGKLFVLGIIKLVFGWVNWVSIFILGDVVIVIIGVWIIGMIKVMKDQENKWGVVFILKFDVKGVMDVFNFGGFSWYVIVFLLEKKEVIDFFNLVYVKDVDFYQKIFVDQGVVGLLMEVCKGVVYEIVDKFFGGEKIWQKFVDWFFKVFLVNYGMFINEVDFVVVVQLLVFGKGGDVDVVLKVIEVQVKFLMQ